MAAIDKTLQIAIRKMNDQSARLLQASEKRVKRLTALADKATNEQQRERYIRQALQTAQMTEASLARTRDQIAKLESLDRSKR